MKPLPWPRQSRLDKKQCNAWIRGLKSLAYRVLGGVTSTPKQKGRARVFLEDVRRLRGRDRVASANFYQWFVSWGVASGDPRLDAFFEESP